MENISKVYIGVDVSKNSLDIYINSIGKSLKIANSEVAIKKFIKILADYDVAQIACEATGGYEKQLNRLLKKSCYRLWIVDPRRIKGFITASGCKSKTDKIDAQKIAEFASKYSPDYQLIERTDNQIILLALVNRRNDLVKFLSAEKIKIQHPSHELCLTNIKKHIKFLEREIKSIDLLMQKLVQQDEKLKKKAELLESIPGIGKTSTTALLSSVPELGQLSNKKISALIGLAPYDHQSGNYKGKKFIRGGRIMPRNMLYMCALTAIKYHLPLKQFYDRLRANNKPFKVALVAVMHKLIIIANSIIKKGEFCMA